MRECSNCGTKVTCGCQDRIASNGVRVCANCISSYEQHLLLVKSQSMISQNNLRKDENLSAQ